MPRHIYTEAELAEVDEKWRELVRQYGGEETRDDYDDDYIEPNKLCRFCNAPLLTRYGHSEKQKRTGKRKTVFLCLACKRTTQCPVRVPKGKREPVAVGA